MGQIVFNGQKPKYCNLTAITTGSKKDYLIPDGEIWLIDSTNTSKTDGTGKYDYYIKGDGSNTASQLAANKIKVDDSIDISGKADKSEMSVVAGTGADADKTTITLKSGTSATVLTQHQDVSEFLREGEVFGTGDDSTASFNPYSDTVWNKAQTFSESQKQQIRENIGVSVTDSEDIQSVNGTLKFADRAYTATTSSVQGNMGYKILRKNSTFASQVTAANTIYEIRYDYDLNAQTFTMPAGCVLKFNGGSISNGLLVCQNTSITSDKLYPLFKEVKVTGTLLNSRINVIWFGIMPNDDTIDATQIITNHIQGYKGEIYFPQGNYYLSEWHYTNTSNDCLQIVGDPDVGLGSTTVFYPFTDNQRYIIKIGGTADAINGTGIAWNVRIMDISFRTEQDYIPSDINIGYSGTSVTYPHAALILDAVEKGRFGINGSVYNTPFVIIGYVGEATFDYITCYTCQGPSDIPVISIINSTNKSVTASMIKRLECETIAGPVIWACSGSSTSELYINNVFYEGTVCFSAPNGCLSDQQNYTEPIDYNQYTQVPIFDFSGYASPRIDRISLTQTDITWLNSKDEGNTRCVRTLYNGNEVGGNFNIREIIGCSTSKYLAVKSKSSNSYRGGISVQNIINSSIIPLDSGVSQGGIINVGDDTYYNTQLRLDTKVYKGQELYSIQETIKDSGGNLQCFPTYIDVTDAPVIMCRAVNNAFLIRKDGFYIDSDTAFISLTAYKLGSTAITFWLFYFDGNGEQIGDKVIHSFVMTAKTWNTYDIPIDISRNFAYIKLQYPAQNGYVSYIKDITIVPQNAKHIASTSTTNDLNIGDSVLVGTTNKLAKYGYTINGIVKEVTTSKSNTVTYFENQVSTFVVKFLSTFNNYAYVRFLKEQDWNSADYVEITLPAYTYERVFEPLDKTVYPYVGIKCSSPLSYYVYKLGKKIINGDGIFVDVNRIGIDNANYASLTPRPKAGEVPIGFAYYDYGRQKVNFVSDIINGAILWREADGAKAGVVRSGTFADKPASADIYVGFCYFCTDKQTTEGATDGIVIFHKGNDIWVDALGRVVS